MNRVLVSAAEAGAIPQTETDRRAARRKETRGSHGVVLATLLAVFGMASETAGACDRVWTRLGPVGGEINFHTVIPQNNNTLYAASSFSGVFKSTNGGTSWTQLHLDLVQGYVSALAVDSQQPARLYAATSLGIFKSSDGGESWKLALPGLPENGFSAVTIDPRNPSIVYAGEICNFGPCDPRVFRSANGGETWIPGVALVPHQPCSWSIGYVVVDPQDPSTVYATTSDCNAFGGSLWKSRDGGMTWTNRNSRGSLILSVIDGSPLAVDPQNPSTLYTGILGRVGYGIGKSTDGGETWNPVNAGLPVPFYLTSLTMDPQNPRTLYAGSWLAHGVFKSIDGGTNWIPLNDGLGNVGVGSLAISPGRPRTVYAITAAGVFKINDETPIDPGRLGDFNADGKSDILWRHTSDLAMWLMNGTIVCSRTMANIWSGWAIAGVGDFDGNGKADILWREKNGDVAIWLMDGQTIASYRTLANVWTGWAIAGVGDFDGNGKADILWREANGDVAIWLMDGQTIASYRTVANIWTGWAIAGVGDFDGNGKSDILWREGNGDVAIWSMDGPTIASYRTVANIWTSWAIAGVGDFDGNRKADILWREGNGDVAIWLMDGPTIASYRNLANIWTGWAITAVADFDGNGKADILWREANGDVAIWLMDGMNISKADSLAQ